MSTALTVVVNCVPPTVCTMVPAGILTACEVTGGGLYLNTINYLGRDRVTGSYIGQSVTAFSFQIPNSTNNVTSSLPTVFLSDPTVNPSLAVVPNPVIVTQNPSGAQQIGSDAFTNFTTGSMP